MNILNEISACNRYNKTVPQPFDSVGCFYASVWKSRGFKSSAVTILNALLRKKLLLVGTQINLVFTFL